MKIFKENFLHCGGALFNCNPTTIVLHHSGIEDCPTINIVKAHKKRGYATIGYHFYIRTNGHIFLGRDLKYIGAHCKGANYYSIGVCLAGNFEKQEITIEQKESLCNLLRFLVEKYYIKELKAHCELFPTKCPGKNIIKHLNEFKRFVPDSQ